MWIKIQYVGLKTKELLLKFQICLLSFLAAEVTRETRSKTIFI